MGFCLLPMETATLRDRAADREEDEVQSGKPRGEQGNQKEKERPGSRQKQRCVTEAERLAGRGREGNKPKVNPPRPGPRQEAQERRVRARAEGHNAWGRSPPPAQPKEMGRESLTCCAEPLCPDAWVPL